MPPAAALPHLATIAPPGTISSQVSSPRLNLEAGFHAEFEAALNAQAVAAQGLPPASYSLPEAGEKDAVARVANRLREPPQQPTPSEGQLLSPVAKEPALPDVAVNSGGGTSTNEYCATEEPDSVSASLPPASLKGGLPASAPSTRPAASISSASSPLPARRLSAAVPVGVQGSAHGSAKDRREAVASFLASLPGSGPSAAASPGSQSAASPSKAAHRSGNHSVPEASSAPIIPNPSAASPGASSSVQGGAVPGALPQERGANKRASGAESAAIAAAQTPNGPPPAPEKAGTPDDAGSPASPGASTQDPKTASLVGPGIPASAPGALHSESGAGDARGDGLLHSGIGPAAPGSPGESASATGGTDVASGQNSTPSAMPGAPGHAVERGQPVQVDPYQRMDQGGPSPAAVLHAASNRVTVGVHDPTLGWLEINTHSSAGQLSAALVTVSSQSHDTLAAQLPSIIQYLADQQVKVSHLGVEQQMAGGGSAPGGDGSGSNANGGSPNAGSQGLVPAAANIREQTPALQPGWGDGMEASPLSYISVRA